jgi:hypothetical protein
MVYYYPPPLLLDLGELGSAAAAGGPMVIGL